MIIKLEPLGERDVKPVKEIILETLPKIKNVDEEVKKAEKFLYSAKALDNSVCGCIYINVHNEIWYRLCELKLLAVKNNDFPNAKLILEEAEKLAIEKGCKMMQTAVEKEDKIHQKFYKKSRFKKVNYFYHLGEVVFIYQKNLTGKGN